MAKYGPDDLYCLIGGYELSGDIIQISAGRSGLIENINGLGDTWVERGAVGVKDSEAAIQGFYDDAANGTNDALVEAQGTAPVFVFGLGGNAQGKDFVGMAGAMVQNVARNSARGELQKISAAFQGNGASEDGEVIQSLSAESGAGATSDGSEDNAASSAGGGAIYLEVTALTLGGYTSITVTVEDSANDSTWATLGTFTAVTAAPFAERVAISGTIDRYVRATLTLNGAGSGESITLLVGLVRL